MNLVYPGSFDPLTFGHLDVIERSSKLADKLYVAVLNNINKSALFSLEERIDLLEESTRDLGNVEIISFQGLLVDLFKVYDLNAVVRGLRAVSDFDIEFQMAQINREMNKDVETLFMMTRLEYAYLSSSIVKEIARHGGNINEFVPANVVQALRKKEIL
ncbi:MAG: pantetheine-phosphate adenylyltransferase [Tissierellia bacterium]|nr:pantetheine-phosphate adenylyltransferase [Tissierellia bacterium]